MEEKKIVFHIIQDLVSIRNCKTIHAYINLWKVQNRAIFFVLFVLLCVCKAAPLLFLLLKMPPNLNISSFFQLVICWNKNGWSGEATSLWSGLTMTENVTKCPQFFSSYFICYTKYTSHFNSKFSRPVVRYFLKNLTIRDPILQFVQMNLDLKVGR